MLETEIYSSDSNVTLTEYPRILTSKEKLMEDFLEKNPTILEKGIMIIGRQVDTGEGGIIDLLGLDKQGNVVIIELKKEKTPRTVIAQILEYGHWAQENLSYDNLNKIAKRKHIVNGSLMEKFIGWTGENEPDFNLNQKLFIVAEEIDEKIESLVNYLNEKGIDISCVELNFFKDNQKTLISKRIVAGNKKFTTTREIEPHSEQDHLEKGRPEIVKLYEKLKNEILSLGSDVRINPVQQYIGFIRNSIFIYLKIRKTYLRITIIASKGLDDPSDLTSPHSSKDHPERRWIELREEDTIPDLMELIKQAYQSNQ